MKKLSKVMRLPSTQVLVLFNDVLDGAKLLQLEIPKESDPLLLLRT